MEVMEPLNVEFGNEGILILPEDVLLEILIRLRARHVVRLRCVCKSWCALIDDVGFIKRHYQRQYAICKAEGDGDVPLICIGPQTQDDLMSSDLPVCLFSKHNGDVPLDLKPDLVRDSAVSFTNAPVGVNVIGLLVGAVNGVVCFIWDYHNLGLWNPAIREFKAVPPWLNRRSRLYLIYLIGFGFDCISNDFKIVRGNHRHDGKVTYEVYSLMTNSWKGINEPSLLIRAFKGMFSEAYLNGVCYWSVRCRTPSSPESPEIPLIMSFNFSTEVFEFINQPQNTLSSIRSELGYGYDWTLTVYKECLAFVVYRTDVGKAECNFNVWVFTDFQGNAGNQKSWQLLFTIGPLPSSDGLMFGRFRTDDDVLFTIKCPSSEEESSLYNPSTGTFKNLGFLLSMFSNYVESLFSLSERLIRS